MTKEGDHMKDKGAKNAHGDNGKVKITVQRRYGNESFIDVYAGYINAKYRTELQQVKQKAAAVSVTKSM